MSRRGLLTVAVLLAGGLAGCTNGVVYDADGLPPQTDGAEPAAAPAGHAGHEGAGAAVQSGQTADPTATLPAAVEAGTP